MGKGETAEYEKEFEETTKCWLPAFSPLLIMFSKGLFKVVVV